MKTKKILFGLIEINGTLYNILYTLLCVFVLLVITIALASMTTHMFAEDKDYLSAKEWCSLIGIASLIYFVGSKLMDKNNYT